MPCSGALGTQFMQSVVAPCTKLRINRKFDGISGSTCIK